MIRPTLDLDGPIAKAMTDEQLIEPVYGSTHQIVNRDKFNASPRAAKVRALAEAAGRVQPSRERRVESLRQVMTMHPPEKPLTAEQIKGREIFSEAKCRELLNGDGGGKLKSV